MKNVSEIFFILFLYFNKKFIIYTMKKVDNKIFYNNKFIIMTDTQDLNESKFEIKNIINEINELKKTIDTMFQFKRKYMYFEEFTISNLKEPVTVNLLEDVKNVSSIIDKLLANNHIPPAHIPSKNLNAENFFGMLAGKIDENILNKFNKKSTYDLKNDIYFSIIKKAGIDRIFYGNYADIDDIELIVIIILSEALLAKKSYEEILKKEGDKDFLENKLKDLYLKKIEMLEKL